MGSAPQSLSASARSALLPRSVREQQFDALPVAVSRSHDQRRPAVIGSRILPGTRFEQPPEDREPALRCRDEQRRAPLVGLAMDIGMPRDESGGDVIVAGQPVAKIFNAFGKLLETVVSAHRAVVLGHSDSSVAFPGKPVVALGLL